MRAPWAGPGGDPQARDAFVAQAARLAGGTAGLCLVAGGATEVEGASKAVGLAGREVALLLPEASFRGMQSLKKVLPPQAAATQEPGGTELTTRSGRIPPVAVLMTLGGVLVVLLLLWLLRRT